MADLAANPNALGSVGIEILFRRSSQRYYFQYNLGREGCYWDRGIVIAPALNFAWRLWSVWRHFSNHFLIPIISYETLIFSCSVCLELIRSFLRSGTSFYSTQVAHLAFETQCQVQMRTGKVANSRSLEPILNLTCCRNEASWSGKHKRGNWSPWEW